MSDSDPLYVCWTTVESETEATKLAKTLVDSKQVACVQIDGPITSFYHWENRVHQDQERRLWIKCLAAALPAVEALVRENHPYDTPQWVCVKAEKVGEKYLKWAREVSNLRGFL